MAIDSGVSARIVEYPSFPIINATGLGYGHWRSQRGSSSLATLLANEKKISNSSLRYITLQGRLTDKSGSVVSEAQLTL